MTLRPLHLLLLTLVGLPAGCADDTASTAADTASDAAGDLDPDPDGATPDGDVAPDGAFDPTTEVDADATEPLLVARFEALDGADFYRLPWPFDARRLPGGQPDLRGFPGSDRGGVVRSYRRLLERDVVGFAAMPVVYLEWSGAIPDTWLPEPAETLAADAAVQLIDLTDCTTRVPLVLRFDAVGNTFRPANTLMATPVPGFALRPGGVFALLVTSALGEGATAPPQPAPGFVAALSGEAEVAVNAALEPLLACLDAAELEAGELLVGTVFSVQDARAELLTIRDALADQERTPGPITRDVAFDESASGDLYETWSGWYDTPIFQRGESPYASVGGGFVFDETGEPEIQRWEAVPFVVSAPRSTEGPLPVLIWMDGTGASLRGHLFGSPVRDALAAGFAVASFAPQFTDARAVPGSDPTVHGFNWVNGEAGRTVFRQQAADTSYFVRVLREALPEEELLPELDTSTLVYASQSQGSLIGAMLAGVEPEITAFALNGTGAYISATVELRKEPVDFARLLQALLGTGDTIDVFHPVTQLVQLGAEPVDTHNYAHFWSGWEGHPSGSHVFLINGLNDPTTPRPLIDNLTIVGDLAPLAPPGWDVDPYGVWERTPVATPLSGNRQALDGTPLTLGAHLDADQGHFTIYNVAGVRAQLVAFLRSAVDGTPVIPAR